MRLDQVLSRPATGQTAAAAANTQTVNTLADPGDGYVLLVTGYTISANAATVAAGTFTIVSGAVTLESVELPTGALRHSVEFTTPLQGVESTTVVATLSALGAAIVGRVTLRYKKVPA